MAQSTGCRLRVAINSASPIPSPQQHKGVRVINSIHSKVYFFCKRDVWSCCHGGRTSFSRGYQLFCRQDRSFPAVLCNSKWVDHKCAVSCFVKGGSALKYSLFLKWKYKTWLPLSPCLPNCCRGLTFFESFGSAQSLFFRALPPDGYRRTGDIQQPHAVSNSL